MALSESKVHWRSFLESLVERGLRGVAFIVSDDHAGSRAARRAVLGGATLQRCQFNLACNAIHHALNAEIRKRIGAELRAVWNTCMLATAENALAELLASYRESAPKLATWLEENVPEGLAVFTLPEAPSPLTAHLEPDGACGAAGAEAPHGQGQGLSERGLPPATRQRNPRRDRREMGFRHEAYIKWECQGA